MKIDFSGRAALIAGAGGGMGLQVANDLIRAGAEVTLADLKPRPDDIADGPGKSRYLQGDLTDDDFVREAVGQASAGGRLDYLVNTVGVLMFGKDVSCVDIDLDIWRRSIEVNLTAVMLATRHSVPEMKKTGGGSIIHFSSIQSLRGDEKVQEGYGAAKGALRSFSKSVAIQFAADGIRSNAILPGYIDTPMQDRFKSDPARMEAMRQTIPLKRIGQPEDVSAACMFLLSDASSFITGTELVIDGGTTARP